jgi:hypothetical protein
MIIEMLSLLERRVAVLHGAFEGLDKFMSFCHMLKLGLLINELLVAELALRAQTGHGALDDPREGKGRLTCMRV